MRKLPDCPRCEEDELFVVRSPHWTSVTWLVVRCYECGWHHTFMPRPSEDELDVRVAEAVAQATHCHQ